MDEIIIRKNNGEEVSFDIEKLKSSLIRSGATNEDTEFVAKQVVESLEYGMSTHNIYKLAYSLLRKKSNRVAGRYKLKKAIFELGPTGYPFERLVSELIRTKGYETQSGIILEGNCVNHEVDVYARNDRKSIFAECKFHNDNHRKTDLKVSMYVKSRFEDLQSRHSRNENSTHKFEGWLVTNTRFTADAIDFGNCGGLRLISWDYPVKGNLRQLIDQAGFHPITTMKTITNKEKQALLEKSIVLCRQLIANEELLKEMGVKERKINRIIKEAETIISS